MTIVEAHLIEGGKVTGHQIKGGNVKQTISTDVGQPEVNFDLVPDISIRHDEGANGYARCFLGGVYAGKVEQGRPSIIPEIFVDKKGSTDESTWIHYHLRLDHMAL